MRLFRKLLLLVVLQILALDEGLVNAQDFMYRNIVATEKRLGANIISNANSSNLNFSFEAQHDRWADFVTSSAWQNNYKLKSTQTLIEFGVDHGYYPVNPNSYRLMLVYEVKGYNNATNVNSFITFTDTLSISYQPDSLSQYQEKQAKKYPNLYKVELNLLHLYDVTDPNQPPIAVSAGYNNVNFHVEISIKSQIYNFRTLNNNANPISIYGIGADALEMTQGVVANNQLPLKWQYRNTNGLNDLTPAKFELEWTYVDNYRVDPKLGSLNLPHEISEIAASSLSYDFKQNSTRVVLDTNVYNIPMIYGKGYLVFRVRIVKPDTASYQIPVYGPWSIPETGNISSVISNNNYKYSVYKVVDAYQGDKLNWQYTISFAERGKYKQVLSFYDGLLKNRQSITRFNSSPNKLIATEQIYDYEGRPAISILPTPITIASFSYQPTLSLNSQTVKPYYASDFDYINNEKCDDIILPQLHATALANLYYSSSNSNQAGINAYIPDAGGYPLVQTILTPGFTDRVEQQGGAGDSLQIGYNHTLKNDYTDAEQNTLNKVFGLNVGNSGFYRKLVSRDPNGQYSVNYTDYKGNTVFTSLVGIPDTSLHALKKNEGSNEIYNYTEDLIANTFQQRLRNTISLERTLFNEEAGNKALKYKVAIKPYPLFCTGIFLTTDVKYNYKLLSDCGDVVAAQSGTLSTPDVTNSSVVLQDSTEHYVDLEIGKYLVQKQLEVNLDAVNLVVDKFLVDNASNSCLRSKDWFIKEAVLERTFPCPDSARSDCDLKRERMLEELWPNLDSIYLKRKYGIFTIDSIFGYVGGKNSYYRYQKKSDGSYLSLDDLYGYLNAGYRFESDTAFEGFEQRIELKRLYQDDCVVFPDTVVKDGVIYTDIMKLPVETLVYIFNDKIAEALLPVHPEYCDLKNCFDDTYPDLLMDISNGTEALSMGYLSLEELILNDTLYKKMLLYPNDFPSPFDSLSTMLMGLDFTSLDSIAIRTAYCNNLDTTIFSSCINEVFTQEMKDFVYQTPQIRDLYFKNIRALYLGTRTRFMRQVFGSLDCEGICAVPGLTLVTPAIFAQNNPYDFLSQLAATDSSVYHLFNSFFNTSIALTDTALLRARDSAVFHYSTQMQQLVSGALGSIQRQLINCSDNATVGRIIDTLQQMYNDGRVVNGRFSVGNIEYAILINGVSLNELCNPYLVTNGDFLDRANNTSTFTCNSFQFYDDALFALRNQWLSALQNNSNSAVAINLVPNNLFESKLIDVIQLNNANVFTTKTADKIKLTVVGTDTINFFVSRMQSYAYDPVFDAGNVDIESIQCVNNAFDGVLANHFDGLIGQQVMVMTVKENNALYYYYIWNDKLVVNTPGGDHKLKYAITCESFRQNFEDFNAIVNNYGVTYVDGPNYRTMLTTYMNNVYGYVYADLDYDNFIASCAFTDQYALRNKHNFAKLTFANTAAYTAFTSSFSTINANFAYEPYVNIQSGNTITSYWDLRYIDPALYKTYRDFIASYAGVTVDFTSYLVPNTNAMLVGHLYSTQAVSLASVLPTALQGKFQLQTLNPVNLAFEHHTNYVNYTQYALINIGNNATLAEQITAGELLKAYIQDQQIGALWFSALQPYRTEQYNDSNKQDYLAYTYGFSGQHNSNVLAEVLEPRLVNNVPAYANLQMRYGTAHRPDLTNNLYFRPASAANNDPTLDYILQKVQQHLGNNLLFPVAAATNIPLTGEQLDVFRTSDGMYWYRYFDQQDKMYNIYVRTPKHLPIASLSGSQFLDIKPNVGDESVFSLELKVKNANGDEHTYTAFTDFKVDNSSVLHDVLIAHPLNLDLPVADTGYNCERLSINEAVRIGTDRYNRYIDSIRLFLITDMTDFLVNRGGISEYMYLSYGSHKFNYTLYQYDRVGNLIATVPPAGVKELAPQYLADVNTNRDNNTYSSNHLPMHEKVSVYKYNTLNQVVEQTTPDGGKTLFFYDRAGRLVFSQNAEQRTTYRVSYTMYDNLSRIIETGQIVGACDNYEPYPYDATKALAACALVDSHNFVTPFFPEIANVQYSSNNAIVAFISALPREQVVRTVYDVAPSNLSLTPGLSTQEHLRNRVATVYYYENYNNSTQNTYNYAMHYSYDIAGNVKTLTRDFPTLAIMNQQYKRIDYDYDLISGKVNMLSYNRSFADQYFQRYDYDADNRITLVETSSDGFLWDKDAQYEYYDHGPLARTSIGEHKIQGLDYIYTIQGWLKAINGDMLDSLKDPTKDYFLNNGHAKDIASISLDYFDGDYKPIGGSSATAANNLRSLSKSLYNGNIPRMQTNIAPFDPLSAHYTYDQLNRLLKAEYEYYDNYDATKYSATQDYYSAYDYDKDGNIRSLVRYGDASIGKMDSILYRYQAAGQGVFSNRLLNIADYAPNNTSYTNDIQQYTSLNAFRYGYDNIGNLKYDLVNGISDISWNLQNKVTRTFNSGTNGGLAFAYDGMGQRYLKTTYKSDPDGETKENHTYYVRDAQGNILAVYDYYMHNKWAYERIVRTIIKPYLVTPGKLFGKLLAPIYGGNATFLNTYATGLQQRYPAFTQQLLDTTAVSYFVKHAPYAVSNIFQNAMNPVETYQQLFMHSQNNNSLLLAPAMRRYLTPDNLTDLSSYIQVLASEGKEDLLRTLMSYMQSTPQLTTALLEDYNLDPGLIDNLLDTLQIMPQDFAQELYNIYNEASYDLLQGYFDKSIKSGDPEIERYWAKLEHDDQFIAAHPFVIENDGSGNTNFKQLFDKALTVAADVDTLGMYLDAIEQGRALLMSTNDANLLLYTLLQDTATSVASVYVPQLQQFGDTLTVQATVAASKINIANFHYGVNDMHEYYTVTEIDSIFKMVLSEQEITLSEHHIYGSSRLGYKKYMPKQIYAYWNQEDSLSNYDTLSLISRRPWYSTEYQDVINGAALLPYGQTDRTTYAVQNIIGQKQYEFTNHLGNVLATTSDLPYRTGDHVSTGSYSAALKSAYDYYPFGSLKPGRFLSDTTSRCVTYTQSKWVVKTKDSTYWVLGENPNWQIKIQPAPKQVVHLANNPQGYLIQITDTATVGSNIVLERALAVSANESQTIVFNAEVLEGAFVLQAVEEVNGNERLLASTNLLPGGSGDDGAVVAQNFSLNITPQTSNVSLRLSSPSTIGNVSTGVTQISSIPVTSIDLTTTVLIMHKVTVKVNYLEQEQFTVTLCDSIEDKYRFGFNGQEKDNEMKGIGNSVDFKFRNYDTRVGRFFSVDPLSVVLPWNSPYTFAENDVIRSIDLEGSERKVVVHWLNGFYQDGTPIIGKTSVDIQKDVTFQGPNGQQLAKTEVFYAMQDGEFVQIEDLYEKISPNHPKPSANYDYTKDVIEGKMGDDLNYGGVNPYKCYQLVKRDLNAPDNAQVLEDLGGVEAALTVMIYASPLPGGAWVGESNKGWSSFSKKYQKQIAGTEGLAYKLNGVKFDGIRGRTLLDAKGKYAFLLQKGWAQSGLLKQARSQIKAAKGAKIEWHFAEREAADAVRTLFKNEGISGIEVFHTAIK